MTDLEKKIIEIASKHPEYEESKALNELHEFDTRDPDLIKSLFTLHEKISEKKNPGNKNKLNSWLAYYVGITNACPVGEFVLHKRRTYGRDGFPDIDMDFDYLRRHEIVDYLKDKYGHEYVSNIGTLQKLKVKAALRRAVKVLDVTNSMHFDKTTGREIKSKDNKQNENFMLENEILRTLPDMMKNSDGEMVKTIEEAYEEYPEFKEYMDKYPNVMRVATALQNTISGFGSHPAGILLSPVPLSTLAPLHITTNNKSKDEEDDESKKVIVTQFPMEDVECMGLIKFDILALSTKTAISRACELITEERGKKINWDNVPLDDRQTLDLLNSGYTDGCFQLEEYGMKACLRQINIDSFDDLAVAIAMFRPGPLDYIPEFAGRKKGNVPVSYPHPKLKSITESTYGIICFQEQVMQAFMDLADLTASDGFRFMKGCAKKKPAIIASYKEKFFRGCKNQGIEKNVVEKIWYDLEKFAGYSFNLSLLFSEKIVTSKKEYSIQELYNMKQRKEELPQVFSPSGEKIDIIDVYDHGVLPTYEVVLENGVKVSCTLNHKFLTPNGVLPLYLILEKNLSIIQNVEVSHEQNVGVQGLSKCFSNKATDAVSSESLSKVSGEQVQPQSSFLSRLPRKIQWEKKYCEAQKRMRFVERSKEATLQRAKQNKWSKSVGKNFSGSPKTGGVETKNRTVCQSLYYEKSQREKKEICFDGEVVENPQSTLATTCEPKGYRNIKASRNNKKKNRSFKTVEKRKSRKIFRTVHTPDDATNCLAIQARKIPLPSLARSWVETLSNCAKRNVFFIISKATNRFYGSEKKNSRGIRRGISLLSKKSKITFRRICPNSSKRFRNRPSYDRTGLFNSSYILRHLAFPRGQVQICSFFKIAQIDSLFQREKCNQNDRKSLRITGVKFLGHLQCYDLEVASDDHLYCLASGLVNSNSHAVSYAYESYKTAYLKAHYPTEFIAARMSVESLRRKFEKVEKYEQDAIKHFGITILPASLNDSKLEWTIVGEKTLRRPFLCKGLGVKAAEDIVRHQPYKGSDILLSFASKTGKSVTTASIEAMKDLGLWDKISKKRLVEGFDQIRKDKKKMRGRPTKDMFA